MNQKTIKESFSLKGKGLHTGLDITVTFNPAPENYGYKIQRVDLPEKPIVEALADNVKETQRGTVVSKGVAVVSTIDHGISSRFPAFIDTCYIEFHLLVSPLLAGRSFFYLISIVNVVIDLQNAVH